MTEYQRSRVPHARPLAHGATDGLRNGRTGRSRAAVTAG